MKDKQRFRKSDEEDDVSDIEEDAYHCTVLAEKGYQGIQKNSGGILPKKKPSFGSLTSEEKRKIKKVGTDWVIVENIFGWLSTLWAMPIHRYR